jgi:hypothetical protein
MSSMSATACGLYDHRRVWLCAGFKRAELRDNATGEPTGQTSLYSVAGENSLVSELLAAHEQSGDHQTLHSSGLPDS